MGKFKDYTNNYGYVESKIVYSKILINLILVFN